MLLDNEFIDGDKRFIKNIRKCECTEKNNDCYVLNCRIIQRGEHEYAYKPGTGYLNKSYGCTFSDKKLWLTENAVLQADAAISKIEAIIKAGTTNGFTYGNPDGYGFAVYYEREEHGLYNCLVKTERIDNTLRYQYFNSLPITFIVHAVYWSQSREPKAETIKDDPFYLSAIKNNDIELQNELKVYYRIADAKECSWLEEISGKRILPSLSASFDKSYCVDSDTIQMEILRGSGYRISHRPYFAMPGSTHSKWQLNPHTKSGVDAAPVQSESISFTEFMSIIEANLTK